MQRLIPIQKIEDIPAPYQDTPIGLLLEYHNLGRSYETYVNAPLLVGMCMDNRKHLHIPDNFSYIIRSGGVNLRFNEFQISYAIAVGGVRHLALIGHNQCGMVNLKARKQPFIDGLVESAGWDRQAAEEHFQKFEPVFEIQNEIGFISTETKRLRRRYPQIKIAPFLYKVEDNFLYSIRED